MIDAQVMQEIFCQISLHWQMKNDIKNTIPSYAKLTWPEGTDDMMLEMNWDRRWKDDGTAEIGWNLSIVLGENLWDYVMTKEDAIIRGTTIGSFLPGS